MSAEQTHSSVSSSPAAAAIASVSASLWGPVDSDEFLERLKMTRSSAIGHKSPMTYDLSHSQRQVKCLHAGGAMVGRAMVAVGDWRWGGRVRGSALSGLPQSSVFRLELVQVVPAEVHPPRATAVRARQPPQRHHLDRRVHVRGNRKRAGNTGRVSKTRLEPTV